MRVLGIDTATWTASVGIIDDRETIAEQSLAIDHGSHATTLLSMVDSVLQASRLRLPNLDLVAVSIGPGSFTGLRIGLSTVKGFALAARLPIVGVPTLEALAHAAGQRSGLVCPVLDARKREVYCAAFRWNGEILQNVREAAVLGPHEFVKLISPPCTLIGDGVDEYESTWRTHLGDAADLVPFRDCSPRGASVATLGRRIVNERGPDDPSRLVPVYLRKSEAELGRQRHERDGHSPRVEKLTGFGR